MTLTAMHLTAVEPIVCTCDYRIETGEPFVAIDHQQVDAEGEDLSHYDNICLKCNAIREAKAAPEDPTEQDGGE